MDAWIDTARAELADLLAGLTPAQWEQPSLCAGWRVREVAAHVALTAESPFTQVAAMVRSGFRFDRMVDATARAHAAVPTSQLVDEVRGLVGVRRRPPGTVPADPLNDVLVHTQDIARPLGLDIAIPAEPATVAADLVWRRAFPFRARDRVRGRELVATDVEWRRGAGEPLEAPIGDLLLILTGRIPVPARQN
ncbi:maleylpyruvate isomerase family mycothiol-dependent enzyme [Pseudonocardia sp. WMMC193]|uniref:maleylpyruvate isomerase family mycothiol-dependent enzyme n=1 Tax=Pseudonocardia sp. WMMC193 TaxID=2911965 RepID=UPI001F389D3E|nr:maleylpyruvate isomerase family mycothiol-dependent enzyme [Pseudonocardia sp. WMMC193]MCF7551634.1 maleylpyruvate isomerase family mycothiol-dependent enzyme [Pseudonocardia sp. WMMC193]